MDRNRLFAQIVMREDARTIGPDDFLKNQLSTSPHRDVRRWCATALGRIGDPRALPWLYQAFGDAVDVRAAAAFAVGEIEDREQLKQEGRSPDPRAVPELMRLIDDLSPEVAMRAVEALGKVGSHPEAVAVANRLENFKYSGAPTQRSYLDLAIMALVRLQDAVALPAIEKLAGEADPEIQWRAANALIRLRDNRTGPLFTIFMRMLSSPNSDVRAYAARGLGICADQQAGPVLRRLLPPNDPRTGLRTPLPIRACAVQSLGNLKFADAIPDITAALRAEPADKDHPDQLNFAVQAATALGAIGGAQARRQSEEALVRLLAAGGPAGASAIVALARVMKADPDGFFLLARDYDPGDAAAKRAWAQALGELGGDRAVSELRQLLIRASDETPDVSDLLAVPSVITALAQAGAPDLDSVLDLLFSVHDPVVLRAVVQAAKPDPRSPAPWNPFLRASEAARISGDVETGVAVLDRLAPWAGIAAVQETLRAAIHDRRRNVRIAAIRLLRSSGAGDVPDDPGPVADSATDLACSALAAQRKDHTVALMETTRGNVEIELFPEDAPLTVANFVALANCEIEASGTKRHLYDGLSFMRVVPFFVVQGGDPRNDQEGGPGYTIRCEINMRPFERGSVGMALSGKDTGGSQFFITLSPQPHLDGGYTCFGRVISGMQVVDRLTPADSIRRVTIEKEAASFDYRQF
jgi:cyclophilin family peptidyl-prolyl cis-trans isomerase/HEAT repeat protein